MKYLRRLTRNECVLLKKYKLSIENGLCRKGMRCYEYEEYNSLVFNHSPFQVFLFWNNDISCLHIFNILTEKMDEYSFNNYFEKYYKSYISRKYRINQILQFRYNRAFVDDITRYIIQILISLELSD
jgi:hypothetical protein